MLFFSASASAAPSGDTINFSARLKNSTGSVVPDGYYNVGFRLYTQESGGTPAWSETYYDANGPTAGQDNRVKVVNGYLSVKLGSQTGFSGINWQDDLWLTMNIGGTEQNGTIGAIDWDGEMTPRIQLSAVPYAMNSKTVGGKSANQLVQLGQGTQTDDSNNASIALNKTGSGHLMHLQSSGNDALTIHGNGSITLGATGNQSITVGESTSGVGHDLTVAAGSGESGGALLLQGGNATAIDGDGGDVAIDAGAGSGNGHNGNLLLGTTNATSITIGNSGSVTTVAGELSTDTIDAASAGTLMIGGTNATAIDLGKDTTIHGTVTAQADANSTTAFQVQNADGQQVLTADTINNHIAIGTVDTNATLLVLDTKTSEGDPAGTNGAMYYNSFAGKFRCFERGAWKDCVTPLPLSITLAGTPSTDSTTPSDVTDMAFDLAPNTKYSYKFVIMHQADDNTYGAGFGITAPAGTATSTWCVNTSAITGSVNQGRGSYCGTDDATITTAGTENPGNIFVSHMEGYIQTGATAGSLQLRFRSETTGKEVKIDEKSYGILQIVQ